MAKRDESNILFVFYGDDFTGTTATAEALVETGVPTIIFTDPPTISFLAVHFPDVRAVGVAGVARTLPVAELENVLRPIFETVEQYGACVFLYKVCSTFDSSKDVGNIGRAIELGKEIFDSDFVPVLPAAPKFGRFTVFGHHFARLGQNGVYRLDRHPSMANHPVTPMKESDLRLHLAKQTALKNDLIDVIAIAKGQEHIQTILDQMIAKSIPIVFFDCLYEAHLRTACEALWQRVSQEHPIFMVGSQELGYGFGDVWQKNGLIPENLTDTENKIASAKGPLFVLSGSCATVTGNQILWGVENGFVDIEIQPQKLINPIAKAGEQARTITASLIALQQGRSVIAHTAIGPDDKRVDLVKQQTDALLLGDEAANETLGSALGEIAFAVLQRIALERVVVVGGDTAGRIQKHLRIRALQVAQPIEVGAPLCYVYSPDPRINGLEMAFKGGQAGSIDYFGKARSVQTFDFETAALGKF